MFSPMEVDDDSSFAPADKMDAHHGIDAETVYWQ